jgi:flavin reductase (DIM6/NTAB) family NADH-FMN oxidoreductase RutF
VPKLKVNLSRAVHRLDRARDDLARLLVKPIHRAGTKLDGVKHHFEGTGAPILDEALAFLECKVESIEEHGDHAVVVGEVVNAGLIRPGEILTCANIGWQYAG